MFNKDKLKGKMAENRCTGYELASILGINPSTFYRKSVGESEFTRSEIQKIANVLHLGMQEVQNIFFGEELAETQVERRT